MNPKAKQQSEYYKKFRSSPVGKKCLCSRPAVAFSRGGWVCAICQAIEERTELTRANPLIRTGRGLPVYSVNLPHGRSL